MGKHNKAEASQKGQVAFLGIDLSKKSFQLHGVDARGHVVLKKKLNRKALLPFIANLPESVIGIEACGGSHYSLLGISKRGDTYPCLFCVELTLNITMCRKTSSVLPGSPCWW